MPVRFIDIVDRTAGNPFFDFSDSTLSLIRHLS
jgi:hypothetical protein